MPDAKDHDDHGERFSESWDLPPFAGIPRVYIILGIARSGSTALAEGLISTGLAGLPLEYDNWPFREMLQARWKTENPEELLQRLFASRTTPNGIFGIKVLVSNLYKGILLPFLWDYAPRYAIVKRLDKLAQGVSRWRAEMTGKWRAPDQASNVLTEDSYSFEGILNQIVLSIKEETMLNYLLKKSNVRGEALIYEEFSKNIPKAVSELMERLFSLSVPEETISVRRIQQQRDTLSTWYKERFVADFKTGEARIESNVAILVRNALMRCMYL